MKLFMTTIFHTNNPIDTLLASLQEFYTAGPSSAPRRDDGRTVLVKQGVSSGRIFVKQSTDQPGQGLTQCVQDIRSKPAVDMPWKPALQARESIQKKAKISAAPTIASPSHPMTRPKNFQSRAGSTNSEKMTASSVKRHVSMCLFDDASISREKIDPTLSAMKFPPAIVLRHMPGFLSAANVINFFDDLKIYCPPVSNGGCSGLWALRSSIETGGCSCPTCLSSPSEANRMDIYLHFPAENASAVALLRSGEYLRGRKKQSVSGAEDIQNFSVCLSIEDVCIEEQCWVYLMGFPIEEKEKAKPIGILYNSLRLFINDICGGDYLLGSLSQMSRYWRSVGFKLRDFRSVVHRLTPLCRRFEIDEQKAAIEASQNQSKKRKRKKRAKSGDVNGPQWVKYPDWISIKHCNSQICNRLLAERNELANANRFYVRHRIKANEKSIGSTGDNGSGDSASLVPDECINDLQTTQFIISRAMVQLKLCSGKELGGGDSTASTAGGDPGRDNEKCLHFLDRLLYLFNLLEVWALGLEIFVLPVSEK